ncbi:hypothetical protein LEP1GSC116_0385, partial [Leptospira interrogans serovar Icterohaemorrhagiae str. Verdun HP]
MSKKILYSILLIFLCSSVVFMFFLEEEKILKNDSSENVSLSNG